MITLEKNLTVTQFIDFVNKVNEFECEVMLESDSFKIDAKSLMGVMAMITCGVELTIKTKGSDEEEALISIIKILKDMVCIC